MLRHKSAGPGPGVKDSQKVELDGRSACKISSPSRYLRSQLVVSLVPITDVQGLRFARN